MSRMTPTFFIQTPCRNRLPGRPLWVAAILHVLTFTGCGEEVFDRLPVHPVESKIVYDGGSLEGAIITLHPADESLKDLRPSAKAASDGSFRITTYENGDGAPAGTYKVTVQLFKLPSNADDTRPGRNVLPAEYASAKTSQLSITVREGRNEVPPISLK